MSRACDRALKDGLLCVLSSQKGHASVYQCWTEHAGRNGMFVLCLSEESLERVQVEYAGHLFFGGCLWELLRQWSGWL